MSPPRPGLRVPPVAAAFLLGSILACGEPEPGPARFVRPPPASPAAGTLPDAASDDSLVYLWERSPVVVRTDCGRYAPELEDRLRRGPVNGRTAEDLAQALAAFFVGISALETEAPLRLEDWTRRYGIGHALPILAVTALENLQRPLPVTFGRRRNAFDIVRGEAVERPAGFVDSSLPDTIRILVTCDRRRFRRAALRLGHAFSAAYFDPGRQEIGLHLAMDRFRPYARELLRSRGEEHLVAAAFAGFVVDTFNDHSGHEVAHLYQLRSGHPAYRIPAIAEGESLVQGFTRRRSGLRSNLLWGDFALAGAGRIDPDVVARRVDVVQQVGSPMAPYETDMIVELRHARAAGRLPPLDRLFRLSLREFYGGSSEDVRLRYRAAWAVNLLAIRDGEAADLLRRVAGAVGRGDPPPPDAISLLRSKLDAFLDDPHGLQVTVDRMWRDAERFYEVDPNLAGIFYQWIYAADPADYLALVYLGDILFRNRHYDAAARCYRRAHEIAPERALTLSRLGDIAAKRGDRVAALAYYDRALATPEADPEAATVKEFVRRRRAELLARDDP